MAKYTPVSQMKATVLRLTAGTASYLDEHGAFRGFVVVENDDGSWSSGGCDVHFDPPFEGAPTKEHLVACLAQYAADHAEQCDVALGLKPAEKFDETIVPTEAVSDKGAEVAVSVATVAKRAAVEEQKQIDAAISAAVAEGSRMMPIAVEVVSETPNPVKG